MNCVKGLPAVEHSAPPRNDILRGFAGYGSCLDGLQHRKEKEE